MRPIPSVLWLGARALVIAMALAALLAGCAIGGQSSGHSTGTAPGPALPMVLVTSVIQSPQGSVGYATLHIEALDPGDGGVRWSYQTAWHPWHTPSAPVVAGGIVYAESDTLPKGHNSTTYPTGRLVALAERDGHTLWSLPVGFLAAAPVVANGVIYVSGLGTDSARHTVTSFYALRASDGKQLWRTDLTDQRSGDAPLDQGFGILDNIQLVDGALYIRSNQVCFDQCAAAYLLALRASDGKQLWKDTIPGNLTIQPPVVAGGSLYVFVPGTFDEAINAMGPSKLVAYNASDGKARWSIPSGAEGPIYAGGDSLYVSDITRDDPNNPNIYTYTRRVLALDAATGATRWSFTSATKSSESPLPLLASSGDMLYVQFAAPANGAQAYTLAGLDPRHGSIRWRTPLPHALDLTMLDGATLYAISSPPQTASSPDEPATLMAFPAAGGPPLWTASLKPAPSGGKSVALGAVLTPAGSTLYAAYVSSTLSAFDTQNGHTTRWTADAPGALVGVTVVS